MNAFDLLKSRGYVYQTSNDDGVRKLLSKPVTIYQGFDPSADSFHAGHIVSLTAFCHLLSAGHKVIFLLGGGTGLIGDPTGKMKSRPLLSESEVKSNLESLEKQAKKLLGSEANILFLNNADWLTKASLFEYLRNITPYISVNQLLTHETYQTRLAKNLNLSLLEFLYSSLQAWDFLYLFEKYNCRLQIGGQDQWRNILDGVELVRKIKRTEVFALTFPLLTVGGRKMGKSERGTVWLDPQKTSPFEFYQYWVNTPDDELERDLKLFTLLSLSEIERIMKNHPKEIQHRLAFEVTKFIHGEEAARQAQEDSKKLFGQQPAAAQKVPTITLARSGLAGEKGQTLVEVLVKSKLVSSKSGARRLIEQGGVRLNRKKITDPEAQISENDFDSQGVATLQVGKRKIVKLTLD